VRAGAGLIAAAPLPEATEADGRWPAAIAPLVRPCRLRRVRDAPPVAFRSTPEAVYIVGTSASPVGDDHVSVDVEVEPGAGLTVRSAASAIAWTSNGSSYEVDARVAPGASLDWQLQPLIATAMCNFSQHCRLHLYGDANLRWAEEVVLGRHGESPGLLNLRLDVVLDDAPLLRHELSLRPDQCGWDGPAVLGANRAIGLCLFAGNWTGRLHSHGRSAGDGWAVMPLEGRGVLVSAIASDVPRLRAAMADALA
jgi:urease accessory protein